MFLKDVLNRVWTASAERGFCDSSENVKGLESPRKEEVLPVITEEFIGHIARACHEVNRVYCGLIGDDSQLPWDEAPDWQQQSACAGVRFHLENPEATPEDIHRSWLDEKRADGWSWGLVKDPAKKKHPCFVPYKDLPPHQQIKDHFFTAVVKSFL